MADGTAMLWDRFLTERDARVFDVAGFGGQVGFGRKPALLIVDVNNNFCGPVELPVEESAAKWRSSCGEQAWDAVRCISMLLPAARRAGVPVIYTTGRDESTGRGRWHDKVNSRTANRRPENPHEIVRQIAPEPSELVIEKSKPSAFFNTMLVPYLIEQQIDSLIVCGGTTSGCVRATVVDAFSHNYRTSVVLQGTFDRGEASHAVGLFDMKAKYADVVNQSDVLAHLVQLESMVSTEMHESENG